MEKGPTWLEIERSDSILSYFRPSRDCQKTAYLFDLSIVTVIFVYFIIVFVYSIVVFVYSIAVPFNQKVFQILVLYLSPGM